MERDPNACILFPAEHLQAVEKVRALKVERILTAHDYRQSARCGSCAKCVG